MEENRNISDRWQMTDILIPQAELSAFSLEDNDQTKKLIEETKKKQDTVLRLKEVNEARLRMVVQL